MESDDLEIDLIPNPRDDDGHRAMKECIKLHNHVIKLVLNSLDINIQRLRKD